MSEVKSYYKERLPDLIERLKSQVKKNMRVISLKVESDLEEEKYVNVLKGRRMAIENCIRTMKQVDKLQQEIKVKSDNGYYDTTLPYLINKIKAFIDLNLDVVDIEVEDEYPLTLCEAQIKYETEMDKKLSKKYKDNLAWICQKLDIETKLSEDKFHHILKAREVAGIDIEWALRKVDQLENELNGVEVKKEKQKSWAVVASES